VSDPVPQVNPYAPSPIEEEDREVISRTLADASREPLDELDSVRLPLWRTSLRWLLVCSVSAAPSFAFGLVTTDGRIAGMCVGILIFIVGYTWIDFRTAGRSWRRRRQVRRTLRMVYGTRIAISILFPIGAYLDLFCGLISITITEPITRLELRTNSMDFFGALLTTLVQGCLMNVVLGIYGLLLLLIQAVFTRMTK
jgi:hypothetical protein